MKSCYGFLESSRDLHIPWKQIWNLLIPLKVQFFLWTASLGKISTIDNLIWKGMYITNICLLNYGDGESVSHTLMHCPFVSDVWYVMLADFRMNWVIPPNVARLLVSWRISTFNEKGKKV